MLRVRQVVGVALIALPVICASRSPVLAQQIRADDKGFVVEKDFLGPTGTKALEALLAQPRGFIGVQMINLTEGLRVYFGVPEGVGVLVAETTESGPAATAGLRAGDVIIEIDQRSVDSSTQVADLISHSDAGTVNIGFIRDRVSETVSVPVEQRRAVVLRLSPSIIRQRVQTGNEGEEQTTFTVQGLSEGTIEAGDLDLAVDQLKVFFAGDGLRRKMERIEKLDLQAMEQRIRELESELEVLEGQVAVGGPPP